MSLTELGAAVVTLCVYHGTAAQRARGSRRGVAPEDYTKTETSEIYSLKTVGEKKKTPINAPQIKKKKKKPVLQEE